MDWIVNIRNLQPEKRPLILIAEMGSSFLGAHCQIENQTVDNSIAYISNWIEQFKNKKLMIITAAAQDQKAYEYLINKK